jgi:hypothetical protein
MSSLTDLGLPVEPGRVEVVSLFYSEHARALIATTDGKEVPRRLFVRGIAQDHYVEALAPTGLSFRGEVKVAQNASVAFSLVADASTRKNAVVVIDLPSAHVRLLPAPVDPNEPAGRPLSIRRLVGVAANGTRAFVVLCYEPKLVDGVLVFKNYIYKVVGLPVESGPLDIVTILPTPFA